MAKPTTFVGLDVHKDSIAVALAEGGRFGEVHLYGTIGGDVTALVKLLKALRAPGRTLHFVYEAGPCGFTVFRELTARGEDCAVVSPSMIPKRSADRVKADRRDALTLARLHRAGELRAIYVPDEGDEAMRDLVRAREDAVEVAREGKQRLQAFLLRHGLRYRGKAGWTVPYRRWLAGLRLEHPGPQIALEEYLRTITETEERIGRLTNQLAQLVPAWRWASTVAALQAMRAISFITATGLVAELGDLQRFAHPRELMAYLGLVPSEYSSGPSTRRGHITKAGNPHARRLLAEAAWACQSVPRVGREMLKRQEQLPHAIRALAGKAQLRLTTRFRRLGARETAATGGDRDRAGALGIYLGAGATRAAALTTGRGGRIASDTVAASRGWRILEAVKDHGVSRDVRA